MRFVLNLPLPSHQGEQALGCRPCGAQARDALDHFHPLLARCLQHHVTSQLKDLRQPRPITVAHQGLTRRDIARFDAPMANIHSTRGVLPVADWRARKDQRNIGPQPRRVLFDAHDVLPTLVSNCLRDVTVGQERVHHHNATFQDHLLSNGLDGRDRIAFVINGVLGQGHAHMVRQRREQVGPRRPWFFGTASRFPIQGPRDPRCLRHCGQTRNDTVGPGTQVPFELVPVHVPNDGMECGRTGWGMGEAESRRDPCAIIASPCGDGTTAACATQHRTTCQSA